MRWDTCGLCEQEYHGVVACALRWACWKTYSGRPETDDTRSMAMTTLGNGLSCARHHADALSVQEARLSLMRRVGAPEEHMLAVQGNLASTYVMVGQLEQALRMQREVYSRRVMLNGKEHSETLTAAGNYALNLVDLAAYNYETSLTTLGRFEEAKALMRKTIPETQRVLGEGHEVTLRMRCVYAMALYQVRNKDSNATLDDLREAVTTLEDSERIGRRVFGSAHPTVVSIEKSLRESRAALSARAREGQRA